MDAMLGYLLKQTQYRYRQHVDNELSHLELTAAQYGALAALQRQPDASNAALARLCFVTPQTMIQILAGLRRRGLVQRHAHPSHGRLIQIVLTPDGQRLLDQAHQAVRTVDERAFAPLTEADREHLRRILQACTHNLAAEPASHRARR